MIFKHQKLLYALILVGGALLVYFLWLLLRPVEIVAVHEEGNHSSVLVKNFPLTDNAKINWWLKNKDTLKLKYDTPKPDADGSYTVVFWLFGEGYKVEGKYDRRCFNDIQTRTNCIDKDSVMMIKKSKNSGLYFIVDDGIYRINNDGKIIKSRSQ